MVGIEQKVLSKLVDNVINKIINIFELEESIKYHHEDYVKAFTLVYTMPVILGFVKMEQIK